MPTTKRPTLARRWARRPDVIAYTGASQRWVDERIAHGDFVASKIDRMILIDLDSVDAFLDAHRMVGSKAVSA